MEIRVKAGDTVKPGDVVLVYEAMKMENDLACDKGGVVKQVLIGEGDVMATGQALIEFVGEGAAPVQENAEIEGNGEVMLAPMGGTVLEVKVNPGDEVKVGDTLLVYEAMKMVASDAAPPGGSKNSISSSMAGCSSPCRKSSVWRMATSSQPPAPRSHPSSSNSCSQSASPS